MCSYWNFLSAVFHERYFHYICFHYSITFCKICTPAKVKKQSFRGFPSKILSKGFAKIFNHLSSHFQNSQEAIFQKHLSVAAFKVININSLFSFIFILSAVFANQILEHFLFILILCSVASFYEYFYDGWTSSMSLICLPL